MAALNSTTPQTREDRTIYRALMLLEKRLRAPGDALSSPQQVRDYLRLLLGGEEREVFTVLFLDAQNRVIEVDAMFFGTLTQTSVYPREVVKRALHHNAGAVIFAHNHPSGIAEPSNADQVLTWALKKALALVDVRVLDHFIVAGNTTLSFEERCLMCEPDLTEETPAAKVQKPTKNTAKKS